MFICTVRASTLKLFSIIAVSIAVLCTVVLMIPEYTPVSTKAVAAEAEKYNYDKILVFAPTVFEALVNGDDIDVNKLHLYKVELEKEVI